MHIHGDKLFTMIMADQIEYDLKEYPNWLKLFVHNPNRTLRASNAKEGWQVSTCFHTSLHAGSIITLGSLGGLDFLHAKIYIFDSLPSHEQSL